MTPAELQAERARLGLGVRRLARVLGVAVSTVARWEAGQSPIPTMAALALAGLTAETLPEAGQKKRAGRPKKMREIA